MVLVPAARHYRRIGLPIATFRLAAPGRVQGAQGGGEDFVAVAGGEAAIAKVMVKAITARTPRGRYKIGIAPRLMPILYRVLPARLWGEFWARQFPVT